ncbi:MAG: NAD-dependent epimerase/dehydratase family protein [Actinobacteria bacterium]|nr:NAD-dependent epimerase/dehydratase family protein [Actinomycetota bacterium]
MESINTIIILGANGMLGRYIYTFFSKKESYKVIPITRNEFDVLKNSIGFLENMLKYELNTKTLVINCIGKIPQRCREQDKLSQKREYYAINSIFPHNLWNLCKKYKCKMIHPTTDCVYSGMKSNYNEYDVPDEIDDYGMSKSLGDNLECTVIRTSIIGREIHNRVSLLEWLISKKNEEIDGYDHHIWNGITCLEYCKLIQYLIDSNNFWIGIRHIKSPVPKSKYELAHIINKTYDLNLKINRVIGPGKIDKTLNSVYESIFVVSNLEKQIKELAEYSL